MIRKPSVFDIKYQNMNYEETSLNYDRDMMLYEQTQALRELSGRRDASDAAGELLVYMTERKLSSQIEALQHKNKILFDIYLDPEKTINCTRDSIMYKMLKQNYYDIKNNLDRALVTNRAFRGKIIFLLICLLVYSPIILITGTPEVKHYSLLAAISLSVIGLIFTPLVGKKYIKMAETTLNNSMDIVEKIITDEKKLKS